MLKTVGVMGPSGKLSPKELTLAFQIGSVVARKGYVLITGGLGGIMEAASKGAKEAGGLVIGICPVANKELANQYVDVAVMTGMGGGRNYMNILSSDVVVAFGSNTSGGTLSEIAFSLQSNTPLMVVNSPPQMQAFLASFDAPGKAVFGETPDDVDAFIDRAFLDLAARAAVKHPRM